jgi:hypothetical protein
MSAAQFPVVAAHPDDVAALLVYVERVISGGEVSLRDSERKAIASLEDAWRMSDPEARAGGGDALRARYYERWFPQDHIEEQLDG